MATATDTPVQSPDIDDWPVHDWPTFDVPDSPEEIPVPGFIPAPEYEPEYIPRRDC